MFSFIINGFPMGKVIPRRVLHHGALFRLISFFYVLKDFYCLMMMPAEEMQLWGLRVTGELA